MKLWIEHLRFATAVGEALDTFQQTVEQIPGDVGLEYTAKVSLRLYDEPLGWDLAVADGTVYLEIEDD